MTWAMQTCIFLQTQSPNSANGIKAAINLLRNLPEFSLPLSMICYGGFLVTDEFKAITYPKKLAYHAGVALSSPH